MRVDLLVTGRIATLAGRDGFAWVEAVAIADGRVVLAGDRRSVEREVTVATRRLGLPPDRVALPGLTDGHLHLADLALAAERLDLSGAPTLADGLAVVAEAHRARSDPAAWLEGRGWDAGRWGGWPTAADLESVAPGRRVALWSHDLHAIWASPSALLAAGIGPSTPDPSGGIIRRLADGTPAGCLHETAAALVIRVVPAPSPETLEAAIVRAARGLLALGLTAIHDPGEVAVDADLGRGFGAYERLGAAGLLPLRVHASFRPEALEVAIDRGLRSGGRLGGEGSRARVGWLKSFADGTLGARTAHLLAPYEPDPERGEPPGGPHGVAVTEGRELRRLVTRAAAHGIATQVHAIGDAAVRASLDALLGAATAGGEAAPSPGASPAASHGPMPRIEHAQLVAPRDVPRFAAGVAACVQPRDLRGDAANARRAWGVARVEAGGYPYASLAAAGGVVLFGTDAPIEPPDPWPAIASAVTRRDPTWPRDEAFVPTQALSLARAIRAACVDPALAAGETDRGRLVPGHRADLVVVAAAALDEPVDPRGPLETIRPDLVILDGLAAFEG